MSDTVNPARDVIIIDAAASTQRIQGRMHTVIRGVLLPEYFELLPDFSPGAVAVPDYQRAVMKHREEDLVTVLDPEEGVGVPGDLLICVRTDDFKTVGPNKLMIPQAVLVLADGHQRMNAAWKRQALGRKVGPFGVKIILGTTRKEEIQIFYQENRLQTKVTTDIHLRNVEDNPGVDALKNLLKQNPSLVSVQWDHGRLINHEIKAHMLYEVAAVLHGCTWRHSIEEIDADLRTVAKTFGTDLIERNVTTFFEVLREVFGRDDLKRFMFRIDVMRALARLFWDHTDFWDNKNSQRLLVRASDIKKIASIKPSTVQGSMERTDKARDMYEMLIRTVRRSKSKPLQQRGK